MDSEGAFVIVVVIIIRAVFGAIAAAIASHKGRNVAGWFFGGLFLDLIGIVVVAVAVLPNLKEKQAELARTERERHRLREQLRQERLKNEAYRQYSASRLDAHDKVLGIDTRDQPALTAGDGATGFLPGASASLTPPTPAGSPETALDRLAQGDRGDRPADRPPPAPREQAAPADGPSERQWFYEVDGAAEGPVSDLTIRSLIRSGRIKTHTLLWAAGLTEWTPAGQISDFSAEVGS